jgi:hypothetical protein
MGDAITGAAREVWDILTGAVTDPGPWNYAAMILVAVAVVALLFRGKWTSWLLIPVLGGLGYWGWHRFGS